MSWTWVALSVLIFTVFEIVLGQGFLIGAVSPGPRLVEPAIGAGITVVFTFFIAFFSPIMMY